MFKPQEIAIQILSETVAIMLALGFITGAGKLAQKKQESKLAQMEEKIDSNLEVFESAISNSISELSGSNQSVSQNSSSVKVIVKEASGLSEPKKENREKPVNEKTASEFSYFEKEVYKNEYAKAKAEEALGNLGSEEKGIIQQANSYLSKIKM